ncbi:MAG TPA: YggS family pyridoxal phosphate-dependent enzyme [Thermoanaerobaculia bacterium]|nr:YggS family pyridoxal phosphate-dependent enzyme [Thermoanaerobaculia bacterium]
MVRDGVAAVRARIEAACSRAGRDPAEVTLVAVSKTFPAQAVQEALAAGITDVGENRVQEAREKKPAVTGGARWHLIGHLQSNKAKDAVRLFDVIQSVDSESLAEKLARAAEGEGKRQEILLQVNIGREPQKSGIDPDDVERLAETIRAAAALDLRGLMAIPPVGEAEETRRWFRALRLLRDRIGVQHLSMGMSEDFEVAIEEGSTMVRVGRAIFGARQSPLPAGERVAEGRVRG